MTEDNLKNNNQNLIVGIKSSVGSEYFSPENFLINNNSNEDNNVTSKYESLDEDSERNIKFTNKSVLNYEVDGSVGNKINFRDNDELTWEKIVKSSHKRKEIFNKFKKTSKSIKPKEFESYHEYFVLHNFKKGKSARGHVDVENVRKNNLQLRTRSRRNQHEIFVREPIDLPGSSTSLSDECCNEVDKEFENLTKRHEPPADETGDEPTKNGNTSQGRKRLYSHLKGEIVESSAVSQSNSQIGERRSKRLLNKINDREISSHPLTEDRTDENDELLITDLYEAIVPKVEQPYRRSDWVLPSRFKYTPDKQMRTKPEFEKVNLSELISVEKIQRVLARFEGGLKGIRKTNWNSMG